MKMWTADEEVAIITLPGLDFVEGFWVCGMLGSKEYPWISVSPDGIAMLDLTELDHSFDIKSCFEYSRVGADNFFCYFSLVASYFHS